MVLLKKPKKEGNSPSDFRPICLINSMAMIFEKLIHSSLSDEIASLGGLSDRQYGFRKGRSTVQVIQYMMDIVYNARQGSRHMRRILIVVMMDIKNTFNSLSWDWILTVLREKGVSNYLVRIIQEYLMEREVLYYAEDSLVKLKMNRGVPQGSIIGPLLWNLA